MPRFGQEPDLASGLFLRTWRDGPQKGQPKIPKAIQSMLDRGLARIGRTQWAGCMPPLAGCSAEYVPALLQAGAR
jgi:hypothetical protein